MEILKNEAEWDRRLETAEILIAEFGSETCGPCQGIRRKIREWAQGISGVEAVYIPLEQFRVLGGQLGIFTVPTVQLYVQGKLTIRESGYFSLEQILRKAEQYAKMLGNPAAFR